MKKILIISFIVVLFALTSCGGNDIPKFKNDLLITEDVVTTAKSSGETAKVLEEMGGKIAALTCIVDRRAAGIEVLWPFYPACSLEAASWEAGECELCKKGVPLVKPGSRKA